MSYGILNPMDENWPRGQFTMGFKIPYDTGAKENTQTKNFVEHPDRPTWQYCRSLWFSARSVWRSNEFQKVWNRFYITYNILYFSSERILVKITQTFFLLIQCTGVIWYFEPHGKLTTEMQLVYRNDHGQLGIRFCFKWYLFLKHATVSMVILLIIVLL